MFDARRPKGRLFYLALTLVAVLARGQGPALTTISEARWSDASFGPGNDRNLLGRFTTQTFTLPRLARSQTFFLRQYDASIPPKYSRYSAALHIDFPLGSKL